MEAPLPPLELCGGLPLTYSEEFPPESKMGVQLAATRWFDADDPHRSYIRAGAELRDAILALLPEDWSFDGKRVLDFGCGAGRVLRHFLSEAERAELHGCDIDRPSIEWLQQNLCPPLHAIANDDEPPLPFPAAHFDLIWAYSVFTHLGLNWSQWLVELHRLLKPDGILIATIATGEMASFFLQRPFDESRVGILVRSAANPWEAGGPFVVHSDWWIRAHWGRAFEVLGVDPVVVSDPPALRQTAVVMRPSQVTVTAEELEVVEADEPREIEARREQLRDMRVGATLTAAGHGAQVQLLELRRDGAWAAYREQVEARERGEARRSALEKHRRTLESAQRNGPRTFARRPV